MRATGWPGRGGRDGTRVIWGYSKFRIAWDDFDTDMLLIFPLELPDVRTAADNCIAVALLVKFFFLPQKQASFGKLFCQLLSIVIVGFGKDFSFSVTLSI